MISLSEQAKSQWQPVLDFLPHWSSLETDFSVLEKHGDFQMWLESLQQLPDLPSSGFNASGDIVAQNPISIEQCEALQTALIKLHPWRKGPFKLFDLYIDTEWRSDWKWRRLEQHLAPLKDRNILDVGCGNGYYGWRMLQKDANRVVGIDPTLIFLMQHLAISKYAKNLNNTVLPLRLEDLPEGRGEFDSVFSMGVIYHCRDPLVHLHQLFEHLKPGGEVVLETLVMPDTWAQALVPPARYARMRNVWQVPTPKIACEWLDESGFSNCRIVDISTTSTEEQRTTKWMRFESLQACLDPEDNTLTIEGHPAPIRAVLLANKPA